MKKNLNKSIIMVCFLWVILLGNSQGVNAEGVRGETETPVTVLPYLAGFDNHIIEYGPRVPNDPGELGGVIEINDFDDLKLKLQSETSGRYRLTRDIIFPSNGTSAVIKIPNGYSKELDLNQYNMFAGTVGQIQVNSQYFKMKNGMVKGGYQNAYGYIPDPNSAYAVGGFIYASKSNIDTSLVFEDITHESFDISNKGLGGFVVSYAGNIFFMGDNHLTNGNFNIKGGNVTFLNGSFIGNVTFNGGNPDAWNNGVGTVNIGFAGQNYNVRRPANAVMGDRRITVESEAKVELTNMNTTGNIAYTNNIANWSVLTIHGSMKLYSYHPAMRTISAEHRQTGGYTGSDAQTYNGQANINVNEGATFLLESKHPTGTYGSIYTYNVNIYAYKPEIFDLRYFGTGNFFFSYQRTPNSNMALYGMDIGVWDKGKKGIGNPDKIWQDVNSLEIAAFYNGFKGNIEANPSTNGLGDFDMNKYGRISNDVTLPMVIPNNEFKESDDTYFVNNGASSFYGSTEYYYPDLTLTGKKAVGATVSIYFGNTLKATTVTDENGNWRFDNFDAKRYPAGNYTLKLTDKDQRTAKDVPVKIKDTLAPVVETKLYKFKQGTTTALKNPKNDSISKIEDETTASGNHTVTYELTEEERLKIISTLGYYEVSVKVADEAGNVTRVLAPVIVHDGNVPSTGFTSGQHFEVPYDLWTNANEAEKRAIILDSDYGNAKGYTISGNTVTDVTNQLDVFKVTYATPSGGWKPESVYPITLTVNGYSQKINMTLGQKLVEMTIKQVYAGTDELIYSDLLSKERVSTQSFQVKVDDSIDATVKALKEKNRFSLDHEGYENLDYDNYQVKIDGKISSVETVPNSAFELIYSYVGLVGFATVPNLNFGQLKLTSQTDIHQLASDSSSVVTIINTKRQNNWQLSVSLPKGIKNDKNEIYLGDLYYVDALGKKSVLGSSPKQIEQQSNSEELKSTVDVRGEEDSGIRLEQSLGNSATKYSGELLWSLEDVPMP